MSNTYKIMWSCRNCQQSITLEIPKGRLVRDYLNNNPDCPNCGRKLDGEDNPYLAPYEKYSFAEFLERLEEHQEREHPDIKLARKIILSNTDGLNNGDDEMTLEEARKVINSPWNWLTRSLIKLGL